MSPAVAPPLIKGYLPVRIRIPIKDSPTTTTGDEKDVLSPAAEPYQDTFMYIKEHQFGTAVSLDDDNNNNDQNQLKSPQRCTLFVANAPVVPGIQTRLLLKSIVGRFGEVVRVTVVLNPRKAKAAEPVDSTIASWWTTATTQRPSFMPRNNQNTKDTGKFAHVVLQSPKQLKKTLKHLTRIMSNNTIDNDDNDEQLPAVVLDPIELQTLADESDRQLRNGDQQDENDFSDKDDEEDEERTGIQAVHFRYQKSLAHNMKNRVSLLQECNAVMQTWEENQELVRQARQAAATEPDQDGFVTVTYGHNEVQAELTAAVTSTTPDNNNNKRRGSKQQRNRSAKKHKKSLGGAGPLPDFYRFQTKEHRKKSLHELRERFEQDLEKVKQLKEEKQYRPFG